MADMIDIDNIEGMWVPSEWIKCGRIYPKEDTPTFIYDARFAVLAVPAAFSAHLPNQNLSITELLNLDLPPISSALVSRKADLAFSHDEPTENDTAAYTRRAVPGWVFILELEESFGQKWFDGAISIEDPRYKGCRYPLWIITWWKRLAMVGRKRAIWSQCVAWVSRTSQLAGTLDKAVVREVLDMLQAIPWGCRLQALGMGGDIETLVILLSDEWFDDDMVNMLLTEMHIRVSRSPTYNHILIAPLNVHLALEARYTKKIQNSRALAQIKTAVLAGRTTVYIPFN